MPVFLIFALLIAFVAIIFAIQNNVLITINFLIWQSQGSLALVLLVTLAVGSIIGWLVAVPTILKRGWKTAREKRKVEDLESRFHSKEEEVSNQTQTIKRLQRHHQDLLAAFSLHDATTGFIHYKSLSTVLTYLLHHLQTDHPSYPSLGLFLITTDHPAPIDSGTSPHNTNALTKAIARQLQSHASIETWLFSNGQGKFACAVPGLDQRSAADYGETLQSQLKDMLIPPGEQSSGALNTCIGGAIAHHQDQADDHRLLHVAEQALHDAQRRGRNRVRILSVEDQP